MPRRAEAQPADKIEVRSANPVEAHSIDKIEAKCTCRIQDVIKHRTQLELNTKALDLKTQIARAETHGFQASPQLRKQNLDKIVAEAESQQRKRSQEGTPKKLLKNGN
jgi:hypothetical protein